MPQFSHEQLLQLMVRLPTDFEPYGERSRDDGGGDYSCGCRWYLPVKGQLGMDWGVCTNAASPRKSLLTFEHQGCPAFQGDPD